ncbi:type I methionyl aminopeptidase [Cohaesibacter celericrescens]|uniref:Methionine aminopeptidase n=1 Tax=Cohaesibacter celericrescens TaxID=2067669 RepID=A0A2N5XUQ8_9HYPH|nr:type I methionyl aminopeptidase [Cohaesibacter celericrescens]PLW78210.1 type I methionyl aminopeptidase [Cohaesibacter celericrescens]
MIVTNNDQLEGLKACGRAVARTIREMGAALEAGMTAKELDDLARTILEQEGAESAPEKIYSFPGATCISIEPVIAHGWADGQTMKAGDLVNIDVSACKNGYFTDAGATFILPPIAPEKEAIVAAAKRARDKAILGLRAGAPMQVIPKAFQKVAKAGGYSIIENLLGCHGVGTTLHDKPEILAIPDRADRRLLLDGMVLAIEPFLSTGADYANDGDREWELFTPGCLTAQFEHSVVISKNGPIILTV